MKQITNKEYEEWQKYKEEKAKGHIHNGLPSMKRLIFSLATNPMPQKAKKNEAHISGSILHCRSISGLDENRI